MIDEPGGMRLAEARQIIDHDYAANEPSSALVYAARRVLVELDQLAPDPATVLDEHVDDEHSDAVQRGELADDGEDLPALLDAAGNVLDVLMAYSCAGGDLRGIATALRLMSPQVRAAVAAVLVRPTAARRRPAGDAAGDAPGPLADLLAEHPLPWRIEQSPEWSDLLLDADGQEVELHGHLRAVLMAVARQAGARR